MRPGRWLVLATILSGLAMSSDPAADQPTPSMNVRADEQSRQVQEALAKIPDETDRELLRLRFFEGV